MRLIQISDLHFTKVSLTPWKLCSKRLIGTLNWVLSREHSCCHDSLSSLPDLFRELNPDWIFVAGDLTSTSLPGEFALAKRYFDRIEAPKIFIPGNHDQYTKKAHSEKRFYKTFFNRRHEIKHRAEFFTLKDHGVEAHQLGNSWWCVALDTAPATSLASSCGLFSLETEAHLREVLQLIGPNDPIAMLNHFPFFNADPPNHRLHRREQLREILTSSPNIRLYFHGHTHRSTIADLQPSQLPIILDGGCPIELPEGSFHVIDLTKDGCSVQPYRYQNNAWRAQENRVCKWMR